MTRSSDRWRRVEDLCHAALERSPGERDAFLRSDCGEDTELQHEVEVLLAQASKAEHFLEASVGAAAARVMLPAIPSLTGRRLGVFQVGTLVGSGGMGDVYHARDTRLGRDVAVKVLRHEFTEDPERLARFEREARLLAALNHPHIASIYGVEEIDGLWALILELVEGPTLADRIANERLSREETLQIASQITEALETAHDKGIVHRDLKPANIKITLDGNVKVLDFGLAKALAADGIEVPSAAFNNSPTLTHPFATTGVRVILGTTAYMSPEQARGKPVGKRADIWAFGCVLYEMLTGRIAFPGDRTSDTIAAILDREPDWDALPTDVPAGLRRLLRRCLEKDPMRRLRDIGDVGLELEEAFSGPAEGANPAVSTVVVRPRQRLAWLLVGVLVMGFAAAVGLAVVMYVQRAPSDTGVVRFEDRFPDGWTWAEGPGVNLAVSPDGRYVAFRALEGNRRLLWIRELGTAAARPLPGTEGGSSPFWSPDGRSLGFFADGKLKRTDLAGTLILTLCDAPNSRGGAWGSDDVIIFDAIGGPLQRVSASGGSPTSATVLNPGENAHQGPSFLPDGRHFVFRAGTGGAANVEKPVYVTALDSPDRTWLLNTDAPNVVYSRRHLLFLRRNTLMAQPFDDQRLAVTSEAAPIAENVRISRAFPPRLGQFSASRNGVLAYQSGSSEYSQLVWHDRTGRQLSALGVPDVYGGVRISPHGDRAAVNVFDRGSPTGDIWLFDLARGFRTRFTFDPGDEAATIWSPDGSRIVFNSNRAGNMDLYGKPANGTDLEDSLLLTEPLIQVPEDWSSDGQFILYGSNMPTGRDLWLLPMVGDRKPRPFLRTPFNKLGARLSPNGRWAAYMSNDSGQFEVYVTPFPEPGGIQQISTDGGSFPRWKRDGTEIFFLDRSNRMVAASLIDRDTTVEVRGLKTLFQTQAKDGTYSFDVSADGQRFLINTVVDEHTAASFTIVLNWQAALGARERP